MASVSRTAAVSARQQRAAQQRRVASAQRSLLVGAADQLDKRKLRILDAAEALFAEQGFAHVSVRHIADAAKANVAAINYHFGSKEQLFEALFARRVIPVNRERLALLRRAREQAKDGKPALRDVVDAFIRPPMELGDTTSHGQRGLVMTRFLSRMLAMPKEHIFLEAYYGEVRSAFIGVLSEILPDASSETVLWRYHLMVGALIYALAGPQRMLRPPGGEPTNPRHWDVDAAIEQVVRFCEAGLAAAPRAQAKKANGARR